MLVDMHLHECTYSTDSFLHLEEIVSIARQKGLDAICITDHDSMGLRERAEAYSTSKSATYSAKKGRAILPGRAKWRWR